MNDELLELLYRSFDDDLSAAEQSRLDAALAASESLRAESERIKSMRSALADAVPQSFAAGFSQRVARRLSQEPTTDAPSVSVFDAVRQMFRYVAAIAVPACVAPPAAARSRLPAGAYSSLPETITRQTGRGPFREEPWLLLRAGS